jgi:protein translocase SecG subunit
MGFLIGLFTVVLVLDSVFLIFLVLLQLPKKEAGAGMAFGGGATEALFGSGSGTVLTKATKYAAGIFMGLALVLSALNAYRHSRSGQSFEDQLARSAAESAVTTATTNAAPTTSPAPTSEPAGAPSLLLSSTNVATTNPALGPAMLLSPTNVATTNLPAQPAQ